MSQFNILDPETTLYGARLLEASAGTGKTFAIEHIFVRLLLEAPANEEPLIIEQILAITFTRAAAREMRMRIRTNIEKALAELKGEPSWPYLRPHANSPMARRRLEDALLGFDRAQIFTIHGFCQRVLMQYALEARVSIRNLPEESFRQSVFPKLLDFLEQQQILCPEQMGRLLSKYRGIDALCNALLNAPLAAIPASSEKGEFFNTPPAMAGSFAEDRIAFRQAVLQCPLNALLAAIPASSGAGQGELFPKQKRLTDASGGPQAAEETPPFGEEFFKSGIDAVARDFEQMKKNYKTSDFRGDDFDEQLAALMQLFVQPDDEMALRRLIFWRGSLFSFLSPSNKKMRIKDDYHSPFLEWCCEFLGPLMQTCCDAKRLFANLSSAWQAELAKWIEEKGLFSPDFLLARMKKAIEDPSFLVRIQQKYRAAIVDEFQDTDAIQWEIFHRLFCKNQRLFYLVGDPKQSIYRFRQADLYTYFQARRTLGEHCSLDTNYRSTPELISALNDLFSDEQVHPWLWLPRENRTESYRPVKAGSTEHWDPQDGKRPLHFFAVNDLDESAFAYIAQEINHLKNHVAGFGSFAILVKDRMQAFNVQTYLQSRQLPCWAKSRSPLGRSFAAHALEEFFEALYFPRDASRLKIFLSGPFADFPSAKLLEESLFIPQLNEWKAVLNQQGLPALFREFFGSMLNNASVYERIKQRGAVFFNDIFQLVEQLFAIRCPSIESIRRFFRELEAADPDEESSARRRADTDAAAIQILTMHASKGLEFDVVFVLGAAASTPSEDDEKEESQAEKLRQLYVALTRARLRLYLPIVSKKHAKEGSESPLELFWRRSKLGQEPQEIVEKLIAKNSNVSLECHFAIQESASEAPTLQQIIPPQQTDRKFFPRKVFSYSSLSQGEGGSFSLATPESTEERTIHTIPRGSETGIVLHKIFEKALRDHSDIQTIVREELRLTALQEWASPIQQMVELALSLPITEDGGTLLTAAQKKSEMEFFFTLENQYFKGFIDLVFIWKERLYFIDWKTNWLGPDESFYSEDHLRQAMFDGDYWFQASLYADALHRAWPKVSFGGAIYLFLRGIYASGHGLLCFQPSPLSLEHRIWTQ